MTDDELRELVASLAVAQAKTDQKLDKLADAQARTDAQLAKTGAKLDRLAEMYGGVGNNQGKAAEEFYFNSLKVKPELNGIRFDFIEKNVTRSKGDLEEEYDLLKVAEEFYFNSLKVKPELNGIRFDFIEKNVTRSKGDLEEEYDLLLVNGEELYIVEVKYRLHPRDIEHLVDRKAGNFLRLFPEYRDYRIHLALATFSVNNRGQTTFISW